VERTSSANDAEKFATYYRDAKTGLDYAINRYYQSGLGRFLTADPAPATNATVLPGNWNKYVYVGSDSVNKSDPLGLCSPQDNPPCYSVTTTLQLSHVRDTIGSTGPVLSPNTMADDWQDDQDRLMRLWHDEQFWEDAKGLRNSEDDCGALASFASSAAENSMDRVEFIGRFSALVPGTSFVKTTGVGYVDPKDVVQLGTNASSTYRAAYRNTTLKGPDNSDQGHHFAFYFQWGANVPYWLNGRIGPTTLANVFSGLIGELLQGQPENIGDINLAIAAANMGAAVASGRLSPFQVDDEILSVLCDR
jgi:RHS repeat-associated protein